MAATSPSAAAAAASGGDATVEMPLADLETVVKHIVTHTLGYADEEEAGVITRILMYAQVRGNSQGVIKVITNGVPRSASGGRNSTTTEHETKLSARLNGNGASGMIVMERAMRLAIAKAREHGMALVATHGTASGTGAIGYFGREIAKAGLVGIAMSQSPELVAPYGSYEPIFGTNPFAVGIPTQDPAQPLVLDMATSAYAWYALKEAKAAGRDIPGDVAYDPSGHPTTDPSAALAGALRVFDRSYKGSHIALMVEILAGALAGGDVEGKWERANWGNLVLAIDPEVLGGSLDSFTSKVHALLQRLKAAKPLAEEGGSVSLPGERSEARAAEVVARGRVRLERNLYEGLLQEYRATGGAAL